MTVQLENIQGTRKTIEYINNFKKSSTETWNKIFKIAQSIWIHNYLQT